MRLSIRHRTTYRYAPPANRVALRLGLFPGSDAGQEIIDWNVTANGAPVPRLLRDAFGNGLGQWFAYGPCDGVEIVAEGVVETQDCSGVLGQDRLRCARDVFLRETRLTEATDDICDLARGAQGSDMLERMHDLARAVREAVPYESGRTTAETTAAEALALGAGVCQDHAHLFITGARTLGIPARYVTGFLNVSDEAEALVETHAWAEAFVDALGWVGFDASNGVCPTEHYVRLICGLDADEAAPIRGNVGGDSAIDLDAHVDIAQTQQ
ncbi:MAG: transglutaminase family protein [Pseudomonadota bacterium]